MLLYDCAAFCCSFQKQSDQGAGATGAGAFTKTFSQDTDMMQVDEVSAFQVDEEDEDTEKQVSVDELHKQRAEMLAEHEKITAKYEPLNFD